LFTSFTRDKTTDTWTHQHWKPVVKQGRVKLLYCGKLFVLTACSHSTEYNRNGSHCIGGWREQTAIQLSLSTNWSRHCATKQQVAGSIPDGVSGFSHWHNPVSCIMALGSTQPLTEMSTRNISWGVKAAGAYGWQPTTRMCWLSRNLGASTSWNPVGLSRPVMGLLSTNTKSCS
jgi:hypothetical protein